MIHEPGIGLGGLFFRYVSGNPEIYVFSGHITKKKATKTDYLSVNSINTKSFTFADRMYK